MHVKYRSLVTAAFWSSVALAITGCDNPAAPPLSLSEALPAGKASVSTKPYASLQLPADNLPQEKRPDFHAGKALAHQPWVRAPTITTARDGLGPIYNARTCLFCHINGGRSQMPDNPDRELIGPFLRISIPGEDKIWGVVPEPVYGDQFQTQSVALSHQLRQVNQVREASLKVEEVKPEAYIYIDWQESTFTYPDQTQVSLRQPKPRLTNLNYGELHPQTLFSLRNSPPIHGTGLLELIPQSAIDALADPQDKDGNGISGRQNRVWDFELGRTVPGRFGLKANRANNLRIVTAAAFTGDVGITNSLFPEQPCTEVQEKCLNTVNGNNDEGVELPDHLLNLTTNFLRNIGVPRRNDVSSETLLAGRELFYQAGCQQCHQPDFTTGESAQMPHLAGQRIWPYTDLLLHDMGSGLADGRPDYEASGSEWRTPPLWGVGLREEVNGSNNLLHDGRARSVEEAILWHGGEAESVKQHFVNLDAGQRTRLVGFVESL
ncbi:MAG: hypothetical protein KUF77_13650 [Candidatus Thiodiazotropha sp. (ex Lucina aurantia)]|nr:hypothetical protein [Candidatus Thiodiazotropha sp. (ex Lucina pensylvanica)]MBT3024392.1 hypothetical protein [Candidatus Thiodiazotropha taylori]MBT3055893.1 hypothetical protein [Candidatus Thiodiazotropha sp. (ex Codakia orbicularis)]MBV2104064.1 hypothetical protein [Candidatus Thiodiazotropha sp. (ex Lucina aurantia)]MBV2099306.1 hypothetical protein [Candidatus Thiodiazotropha sp. (ex Codakia orbicularis)]